MDPKFIIRCKRCRWAKLTTGLPDDLEDLHEVKTQCQNCGRPRQFRCMNCGLPAKMLRIKGNS